MIRDRYEFVRQIAAWHETCVACEVRGPLPVRFEVLEDSSWRYETVQIRVELCTTDRDDPNRVVRIYQDHTAPCYIDDKRERVGFLNRCASAIYTHELAEQFFCGGKRLTDPHHKEPHAG